MRRVEYGSKICEPVARNDRSGSLGIKHNGSLSRKAGAGRAAGKIVVDDRERERLFSNVQLMPVDHYGAHAVGDGIISYRDITVFKNVCFLIAVANKERSRRLRHAVVLDNRINGAPLNKSDTGCPARLAPDIIVIGLRTER